MDKETSRFPKTSSFFIDFIGIVVVFIILRELSEIFIPLVIAYFLFFLFMPVNNYMKRYRMPDALIILVDLLIIIFVVGGFSSVIIDSFSRLAAALPEYEQRLNYIVSSTARDWKVKNPAWLDFKISNVLQGLDYSLLAGDIFTSTFSFLGNLLFVVFFFIFVYTGHQNMYAAISKWYLKRPAQPLAPAAETLKTGLEAAAEGTADESKVKETQKAKEVHHFFKHSSKKERETILRDTFQEITDQIQNYVIAKFIISLAVAVFTGIILYFFKVDFVVAWSVLTFLLNFIPNIGSLIAVVLPVLIALVQFGSIGLALFIAIILIVLHNVFGNFLEPRVFGHRLGLNPLVILLSLLLWGYIWGIVGALLSVPLTAVLKIIISRSDSPNLQFISDLMS